MGERFLPEDKANVLILNHAYKSPFKEIDRQYARAFDPAHFKVTIVYLTGGPSAEPAEYETLFLKLKKKDIRTLKIRPIRQLLQLCRERHFVMAICHRYKPAYIMYWVSRFCPIPHLLSVMHDFETLQRLSHKIFVYLALRHQFVFAGVSDAVRDDIRGDGWGLDDDQVVTLPNSLDPQAICGRQLAENDARAVLDMPGNLFVFGTVGRLHPAKDHLTLIRAMARLRDTFPQCRLVVVGTGPLEATLKKEVAQLNLEAVVAFTGYRPDAWRLMRGFDVYVSSSRKEPFGMVLLEAMAAERPIIATAVDGVPQVMGDTGILVPPGDPEHLAEAMRVYHAMDTAHRAAKGREGFRRLQERFATENFRAAFWQYFQPRGLCPDGRRFAAQGRENPITT